MYQHDIAPQARPAPHALAGVGKVRDAEWVAQLGMEGELPSHRVRPCSVHPTEITVEPVDSGASDDQPAPAVNTWQ